MPPLRLSSTVVSQPPAAADAALEAAATRFRGFQRRDPDRVERVRHPRLIPEVVVELGALVGLIYRTDKGAGRTHDYIHVLEDPPRLVSDPSGRRLFIVGGSYRVTDRGIEG